jgi:uncharacterized damage-inducible protein DinB
VRHPVLEHPPPGPRRAGGGRLSTAGPGSRRVDPPITGDERTLLTAFLDYHRATLRDKVRGLSEAQLGRRIAASELTLGGLVKHLALVEDSWFTEVFAGEPLGEPWAAVDWDADRDWDFHSATQDSPEELLALYDAACQRSRAVVAGAASLDDLSTPLERKGDARFSLRWILLHMIEETARHNGHADLLREAIDGVTGE